jgi:SpoVK/Ycf46/Vps4 family AAA+-type ATPase
VLDRPLLLRRGTDLLSMWVGGTEANLAQAFEQARDEGAVLLIDEADGFLQDRSQAQRSWEVTGVNELLTQMEAFDGLFIASTNLVERLDPAALRRFDFKIRFGFLDRGQRRRLVAAVLSSSSGAGRGAAALDVAALRRLDGMDRLTPGDVANALRQLAVTGEAVTASRLLDLLEGELRLKPGAGAPGIGFLA